MFVASITKQQGGRYQVHGSWTLPRRKLGEFTMKTQVYFSSYAGGTQHPRGERKCCCCLSNLGNNSFKEVEAGRRTSECDDRVCEGGDSLANITQLSQSCINYQEDYIMICVAMKTWKYKMKRRLDQLHIFRQQEF